MANNQTVAQHSRRLKTHLHHLPLHCLSTSFPSGFHRVEQPPLYVAVTAVTEEGAQFQLSGCNNIRLRGTWNDSNIPAPSLLPHCVSAAPVSSSDAVDGACATRILLCHVIGLGPVNDMRELNPALLSRVGEEETEEADMD